LGAPEIIQKKTRNRLGKHQKSFKKTLEIMQRDTRNCSRKYKTQEIITEETP